MHVLWLALLGLAQAQTDETQASDNPPNVIQQAVQVPDEPANAADEPGVREPPPPVGVVGLADLHLHQWAQMAHGERWYHGSATGLSAVSHRECGTVSGFKTEPRNLHGQFVGKKPNRSSRAMSKWGLGDERSDDVGKFHAPPAISTDSELPNWLGWPTSDSVAHQQIWEGWLRLAHDGLPFLAFLDTPDAEGLSVHDALDVFYAGYRDNMVAAHGQGFAGLNLAVVSLVNSNISCRAMAGDRGLMIRNPALCNDMDSIHRQYQAAVAWESANRDWAVIVTTPDQARRAIEAGKLAIVLSIEASDLLGPSETIAEGRYRGGYYLGSERPRATYFNLFSKKWRTLRKDTKRHSAEDVQASIEGYLQELNKVATLQPSHQLDNPFAGAATIQHTLLYSQGWREKRACYKGKLAEWKYPADAEARAEAAENPKGKAKNDYPVCWSDALMRPGKPGFGVAIRRIAANWGPDQHAVPGWYERQVRLAYKDHRRACGWLDRACRQERDGFELSNYWRNPYGLSHHGELLVNVMIDRRMPIDIAHMSWQGVADLRSYLERAERPNYPLYLSHAYPSEWDLLSREFSTTEPMVVDLQSHSGVVGFRPGDDELRVGQGADDPRAELLSGTHALNLVDKADCMGTSVAGAVYLAAYAGKDGKRPTAFGTDLNGFINQAQATGLLRPPMYVDDDGTHKPCAAVVPSVGSEVSQRGLAHVGLLPQLYLEMLFTAGEDQSGQATVAELQGGAEAYLHMWDQSYDDPGVRRETFKATQAEWAGLLFDDGGSLKRISTTVNRRSMDLPRLRAIEAALPYRGAQAPDEPISVRQVHQSHSVERVDEDLHLSYPQLPTNLGFLLGAYTYNVSPAPYHFPYKRCKWSGVMTHKGRVEDCKEIKFAKQRLKTNEANASEPRTDVYKWDHVYPQHAKSDRDVPLTELMTQVPEKVGAFAGMAQDLESYVPVRDWVMDHRMCLEQESFLRAPPPGIAAPNKPLRYLQSRRDPDASAKDSATELLGELGVGCYCRLLQTMEEAGQLSAAPDLKGAAYCVQLRVDAGSPTPSE